MLFRLLEGFSEGIMAGFCMGEDRTELNRILAEQGITIIYSEDNTENYRYVILDDTINKPVAEEY